MTKNVILSTREQYSIFTEKCPAAEFTVYCDNPPFSAFLRERKIKHTVLSEFLLEDKWSEINAWACGRAAGWSQKCKEAGLFIKFDFPAVIFHHFSHLLTQMLKNYSYADLLLAEKQATECALFFSNHSAYDYPRFEGNYFLNFFLKKLCQNSKIKYTEHTVNSVQNRRPSISAATRTKRAVKYFFRNALTKLLPSNPDAKILASGSLRHLGSLLSDTKMIEEGIVFFDDDFFMQKFVFSARNGIAYRIAKRAIGESLLTGAYGYFLDEVKKFCTAFPDYFMFQGIDFSDSVFVLIFQHMKEYFSDIEKQAGCLSELFSRGSFKALLVEEDYSSRGSFLTAFANASGVRTFCISHANVPVDFSVSLKDRGYAKSFTLVNSEYEKENYCKRGWREDCLKVTGTPRYDRLIKLSSSRKQKRNSCKKILVCGGPWWEHGPDSLGYLGLHIECYKDLQYPAMTEFFLAARQFPEWEFIVKPHHYESEAYWREFLPQHAKFLQINLVKASNDIANLLIECDGMVLSYWSTTIIEAAMVRTPILFLNMRPTISPSLMSFSKEGMCEIAYNGQDVFAWLAKLPTDRDDPALPPSRIRYYLGERDARSTGRVIDEILGCVQN